MYCPRCKSEYREGITQCPDCNETLLVDIPQESNIENDRIVVMDPIKVASVSNEVEAGIIMELLLNNQIPCFKKSKEAGQYMNLYMGYSVFGEEIYVDKADYEMARELIDAISVKDESLNEELKEDIEEKYKLPFYKNPKIVARIILIVMLLSMLLVFTLSLL